MPSPASIPSSVASPTSDAPVPWAKWFPLPYPPLPRPPRSGPPTPVPRCPLATTGPASAPSSPKLVLDTGLGASDCGISACVTTSRITSAWTGTFGTLTSGADVGEAGRRRRCFGLGHLRHSQVCVVVRPAVLLASQILDLVSLLIYFPSQY